MIHSLVIVGASAGMLLSVLSGLGWINLSAPGIILTSIVVSIGLHGAWSCVVSYVVGSEFHTEE